jgi:uncharacterized delta-60 repeat protein
MKTSHLLAGFVLLSTAAAALFIAPAAAAGAPFTFGATGSLNTGRTEHTSTLLPNGKVLVVGGGNTSGYLTSAELYDPASGSWTATGSLNTARDDHTATLLPNGKVLVAGGINSSGALTSAELYDPASGSWTAPGSLNTARYLHTATLLPNGKVLVAGGFNSGGYLTSAELYDPASGSWTATGSLNTARDDHTATLLPNGKVLVAGGFNGSALFSAELYDPTSGSWTATGSLNTKRYEHTATLLPNGNVLVAGGYNGSIHLASAEVYDPASGSWTITGGLNTDRSEHTATLLPNGKVLVAGGGNSSGPLTSAELYDPANGSWSATGSMTAQRGEFAAASLLPNGKVLVAGGDAPYFGVKSAQLYDPASGSWNATGDMATARSDHTATLLPDGKVLVASGEDAGNNKLTSAELYDPASGSWNATGSLATGRALHTATLLANGKVLVTGGSNSGALTSAEFYDPASGSWSATGSLSTARYDHTATLLPNGKVLVAGGIDPSGHALSSAELYDPATGTWSTTGSLSVARSEATATLLPSGKVLVAGGLEDTSSGLVASAELYDPGTGNWSQTASLSTARDAHTATLLPNGKVLVAGGHGSSGILSSAELYDPAIGGGIWLSTGSMSTARNRFIAKLLPNGSVLVAGGDASASAEVYNVGLGFLPAWQPQIATATSPLITGSRLTLTGLRFQGISQASGGNFQDSSTNYPVVQLRNIDNSQVAFLPVDPTAGWSDTSFTSTPVNSFPPGPALMTVFTNGIPSDSKYVVVAAGATHYNVSAPATSTVGAAFNFTVMALDQFNNTATSYTGTVHFTSSDASATLPADSTLSNGAGTFSATLNTAGNQTITAKDTSPASVAGTSGAISVGNAPTATPGLVGNVSTRLPVGTGDNVLIEGFIVQGPAGSTKKIIVRAIGPSLAPFGITDALADPTLEIHDASNAIIATNDNWETTQVGGIITADQVAEINASQLAPSNDLESAIIANLAPGSYTAVVSGAGDTVGTGVVDAYDLSAASPAKLANIATRGLIQPGDKLMIAGFIIQNGSVRAVARAIGPSLSAFGITNALADTTLQLRDQNGAIVVENDDWKIRSDGSSQQAELEATGLQPTNDLEAAFLITLPPGQYTAQVRGKPETTGIGVVQVYFLQ